MEFINKVLMIFFIVQILSLIAYIPRMILWFEGFKKQKHLINPNKAKFAIILPARNESKIIDGLLESIKHQTYPKEMFDVHVIVADKNDPTITKSKAILDNCYIHVVENQTRKAEAMDGCFQNILKNKNLKYDDYIVVDADCILTLNFLEEMNNALVTGAKIIIPRKRIKNWESKNKKNRTIYSNCSAMTYVGVDTMGNKGKCKRNSTLALCGQGMLIDACLIEELGGYPFRSLTEDFEIAVECMRKGYSQYYYEYAELYSEEPLTRKEFNKRRVRWLQGFVQFGKMYNKEVKHITFKQGKPKKENFYFLFGLSPLYTMLGSCFVLLMIYLTYSLVLAINKNPLWVDSLLYCTIPFILAYIYLFLYGTITVLEDRDINKMTFLEKIKYLFLNPLITFEYVWILVYALFIKCDGNWDPVKRIEM